MAKVADQYFKVDEWKVIEEGFDREHAMVAESIFSLANEYMGVRGYFEEGYSGPHLMGSYFNGVYEKTPDNTGHYKGIVDFTEYMVNSMDWLYSRILVDGEQLDLYAAGIEEFVRELDMKTGRLVRSFVWTTTTGKRLKVEFERLLSMTNVSCAAQRIKLIPLNFEGEVQVILGIDAGTIHKSADECMWEVLDQEVSIENASLSIKASTKQTKQSVSSSAQIVVNTASEKEMVKDSQLVAIRYNLMVSRDQELVLEKQVCNSVKDNYNDTFQSFDEINKDNQTWWEHVWEMSDIEIHGDSMNQQGIRFCIFQMYQTYHGAVRGANIGAKGLTGEAYNGNAFWDTETYCLPFYLWNDKEAARNLLFFRYKTLEEAKARAKQLDCEGAFYPIATISGKECCNLWQHASLQLQASTAVAYGIWFYEKLYRDDDFMKDYGLEMLVEISRMLATRGDYSASGQYGFYGVMGPDEFQMMVHNNCYTNYMGKFTFEYTLEAIRRLQETSLQDGETLLAKLGVTKGEMDKWENMAKTMYIPYDAEHKVYEQHEGFFNLPHVDIDAIPVEEFPLYHHWTYDRIYRNDMIKQPDVLMLMLLFNSRFSEEELRANYEYYEPRCIHESSLSPSVHSILAAQLGKSEEAFNFFGFATRMDLDNYNRNTHEGIHTTSIAAAWMNIIYGFGGLRSDGDTLSLRPTIPNTWESYTFKLNYCSKQTKIEVSHEAVTLTSDTNNEIQITVYGQTICLGKGKVTIPLQ